MLDFPVDHEYVKALNTSLLDGRLAKASLPLVKHYLVDDVDDRIAFGVMVAASDQKGSFRSAAASVREAVREHLVRKTKQNFPKTRGLAPDRDDLRTAIKPMDAQALRRQFDQDAWTIISHARKVRRQFDMGIDLTVDTTEDGNFGIAMEAYRDRSKKFDEAKKAFGTSYARSAEPLVNRNNETGTPVGAYRVNAMIRSVGTGNHFSLDTYRKNPAAPRTAATIMSNAFAVARKHGRLRFRMGDRAFGDADSVQACQDDVAEHGGGYILRVAERSTFNTDKWEQALKMDYAKHERSLAFMTAYHWLKGDFKEVDTSSYFPGEKHFFLSLKFKVSLDAPTWSNLLIYVEAAQDKSGKWVPKWNEPRGVMFFFIDKPADAKTAALYRHAYLNRMGSESIHRNEKQNFSTTGSWSIEVRDTMWALGFLLANYWAFLRVHQRDNMELGVHYGQDEELDLMRFMKRLVEQAKSEFWHED